MSGAALFSSFSLAFLIFFNIEKGKGKQDMDFSSFSFSLFFPSLIGTGCLVLDVVISYKFRDEFR